MSTRLVVMADTHLPKRARDLPAPLWQAVEDAAGRPDPSPPPHAAIGTARRAAVSHAMVRPGRRGSGVRERLIPSCLPVPSRDRAGGGRQTPRGDRTSAPG